MNNMKKLITETSYDFELHEDKKSNEMFAVGIFSSAELKNNNKRTYKKNLLEREVGKVQDKVEKKCLWGELGHPPNPEVNPDKIAIRTVQLEWRGNDLYGKAKILDTPMGNIARTLVKEGQMGISSRGLGTVNDEGYVNEDFHLITWDLVTDPSNNPSWVNGIYEGTEFAIPGGGTREAKGNDVRKAQEYYFKHLMETLDNVGNRIHEGKKVKIKYRLSPMGSKMRYYDDLSKIANDFPDVKELKGAYLSMIVNSVVVADLHADKIFDEIY